MFVYENHTRILSWNQQVLSRKCYLNETKGALDGLRVQDKSIICQEALPNKPRLHVYLHLREAKYGQTQPAPSLPPVMLMPRLKCL